MEEEYRNWTSMTNDNDIIAHFSVPGTPPLFLCLLWKMILETDRISPIAYKYVIFIILDFSLVAVCRLLVMVGEDESTSKNVEPLIRRLLHPLSQNSIFLAASLLILGGLSPLLPGKSACDRSFGQALVVLTLDCSMVSGFWNESVRELCLLIYASSATISCVNSCRRTRNVT